MNTGACEGSLACSTCHVIVMVCRGMRMILCYSFKGKFSFFLTVVISSTGNGGNIVYVDCCSVANIQDVNYYNKLEDPTDEENDMLDLAFGLSETYVPCHVVYVCRLF